MTDTKIVPKFSTNKEAAAFYKKKIQKKSGKESGKQNKKAANKKMYAEMKTAVDRARDVVKANMDRKSGSYLAIATDEKGKVTTSAVEAPALKEVGMAREFMKSALGDRPFRATLTQQFAVQSSSAGTALSSSLAADLAASNEWSSFAALFDEVRCLQYKARMIITSSGGTIRADTVPVFAAAAQFTTTVALASILVSTHHVGPITVTPKEASDTTMVTPVSHYGYVELSSARLFPGAIGAATASTNAPIQGDWLATTASSGQGIVGYVNLYCDALAVSNTISHCRVFGYYDVEFRLRQ